jgi:hypothetical protein
MPLRQSSEKLKPLAMEFREAPGEALSTNLPGGSVQQAA